VRILLTNITLATRTGTELWIKEAALALRRRGHEPMVYTPEPGGPGGVAAEIRAATVPVVDDLARLGVRPDIIHGHHHQPAMAALLHFPGVPAVFVAHDWMSWNDAPPFFPRILRYAAVDETNRDRLVVENAIPAERVRILLNWVDLERFKPRGPLPERPRRALVFSNYARRDTYLPAIEEACRRAGLALDTMGEGSGRPAVRPEELLGEYDLVFAKARAALEALAVGAAVVLCDASGLGPLVTSGGLGALRRLNLGVRALSGAITPEGLLREVERYDAQDAAEVSRQVRATAGLEPAIDRLIDLYGEVLAESGQAPEQSREAEMRAAAAYVSRWTTGLQGELRGLGVERADHAFLRRERERLADEIAELTAERDRLQGERDRLQKERDVLQGHLDYAMSTPTWRLREAVLRLRARLTR
jgi:hypothetical protein